MCVLHLERGFLGFHCVDYSRAVCICYGKGAQYFSQRLCVQVQVFLCDSEKETVWMCVLESPGFFPGRSAAPVVPPSARTLSLNLSAFFSLFLSAWSMFIAEFMSMIFPLLFALIHKPQHFQKALNSLAQLIFQKPHLNNKPPAPPTHKNHSREKKQKTERDIPAFTSAVMKMLSYWKVYVRETLSRIRIHCQKNLFSSGNT